MKILLACTGIIAVILAAATKNVSAQSELEGGQLFHRQLGKVVDAQENARHNIFGAISGFSAARLHAGRKQNLDLHILRNHAAGAQWLQLSLAPEAHRQLLRRIQSRVQAVARGDPAPEQAVYPLPQDAWKERNPRKRVMLRDGSVLNATLLRAQADTLFVQTLGGIQATIPDAEIDKVEEVTGEIVAGEIHRQDPNGTRLLLAPTGRGLNSGQGYFADYFLFFPTLAVGLTDNLALSGGVSILPGAESQLAYFGPKLSFPISSQAALSTGLSYLVIPEDVEDAGLGYAVGTFGSTRNSLTLGLGIPFTAEESAEPVYLVGGEVQVSNSAKLLTENWLLTSGEDLFLFSGGVRFFGEKLAVDLALVGSSESFDQGFPFVPWVDFSVFFGK
jgi:hypothetical protein